jgi:hypothetical protein
MTRASSARVAHDGRRMTSRSSGLGSARRSGSWRTYQRATCLSATSRARPSPAHSRGSLRRAINSISGSNNNSPTSPESISTIRPRCSSQNCSRHMRLAFRLRRAADAERDRGAGGSAGSPMSALYDVMPTPRRRDGPIGALSDMDRCCSRRRLEDSLSRG